MKNLFVQFKSGRTLDVKDICDYVESQDYDVVVSRADKKEAHVTIFHDAVEYMTVIDIEEPERNKCDNDHDCEHCDWVECPEMKGE